MTGGQTPKMWTDLSNTGSWEALHKRTTTSDQYKQRNWQFTTPLSTMEGQIFTDFSQLSKPIQARTDATHQNHQYNFEVDGLGMLYTKQEDDWTRPLEEAKIADLLHPYQRIQFNWLPLTIPRKGIKCMPSSLWNIRKVHTNLYFGDKYPRNYILELISSIFNQQNSQHWWPYWLLHAGLTELPANFWTFCDVGPLFPVKFGHVSAWAVSTPYPENHPRKVTSKISKQTVQNYTKSSKSSKSSGDLTLWTFWHWTTIGYLHWTFGHCIKSASVSSFHHQAAAPHQPTPARHPVNQLLTLPSCHIMAARSVVV